LLRLADIKKTLLDRARSVAASLPADHEAAGTTDLDLAWSLLARAMRWMRALHTRLDDEAEAAKLAAPKPKRPPAVRLDWGDNLGLGGNWGRPARKTAPAGQAAADDCIDGTPTVAVVAQICADLGAAATALGRDMPPQIAAIAEAARALLGGVAEGWTALPIVRPRPRLVGGTAAMRADPTIPEVSAPDTG
jgi:hypothetical protein